MADGHFTSPWKKAINSIDEEAQDTTNDGGERVNAGSFVGVPSSSLIKPKFGGRIDTKITWVGGPPLSDWSDTSIPELYSPACMQGIDAKTTVTMYNTRIKGLVSKFKKGDVDFTLLSFAEAALEHMKEHGMDTVFYMEGVTILPSGAMTGGCELFSSHSKYTKSYVAKFISNKIEDGTFDTAAKGALKESAKWLKDSLDPSLTVRIRASLSKAQYGPDVWMLVVGEVLSDAIDRCTDMEDKFKGLNLSDYPGENVDDYCLEANDLLTNLEREGKLPNNHLIIIIDAMIKCSVLPFQVQCMTRRPVLVEFIRETNGKDDSVIAAMPNKITFNDLLMDLKRMYHDLSKQWGPANNTKVNEAQVLMDKMTKMEAMFGKMEQQLKPSPTPSDSSNQHKGKVCHGCGCKDTIRPKCPNCKGNRPGGGGSGNNGNNGASKFAPPKAGEPTTKEINGTKFNWCPKCKRGTGRWTKTHTAAEHIDGFIPNDGGSSPAGGNTGATANTADFDLSNADITKCSPEQLDIIKAFFDLA